MVEVICKGSTWSRETAERLKYTPHRLLVCQIAKTKPKQKDFKATSDPQALCTDKSQIQPGKGCCQRKREESKLY